MAAPSLRVTSLLSAGLLCMSSLARGQSPAAGSRPGNSGSGSGTPAAAALDASAALERARIYYESAKYSACVDAFTRLLEQPSHLQLKDRSVARVYLAACLIASGKVEEARQRFRQAILEDRQLEAPDPVVFPQAVVDVFLEVRSSLMQALERQQEEELQRGRQEAEARARAEQRERWRVAELERLASLETVVRRNDRWMAWVPFGMGQFQNEDRTLGWIFFTTEAVLSVTAITATSIELGLHSQAEGGRAPLDSEDLTSKVRAARQVGTVSLIALIGVVAAGILEANLSYRSEVAVGQRKRSLPDALRPPEAPKPQGARLHPELGLDRIGVSGEF